MYICKGKTPSAVRLQYWNDKLKGFGLTEDAGRKEWLSYGHVVNDLDFDGRNTYKPTTGERLETEDEWPISLS